MKKILLAITVSVASTGSFAFGNGGIDFGDIFDEFIGSSSDFQYNTINQTAELVDQDNVLDIQAHSHNKGHGRNNGHGHNNGSDKLVIEQINSINSALMLTSVSEPYIDDISHNDIEQTTSAVLQDNRLHLRSIPKVGKLIVDQTNHTNYALGDFSTLNGDVDDNIIDQVADHVGQANKATIVGSLSGNSLKLNQFNNINVAMFDINNSGSGDVTDNSIMQNTTGGRQRNVSRIHSLGTNTTKISQGNTVNHGSIGVNQPND